MAEIAARWNRMQVVVSLSFFTGAKITSRNCLAKTALFYHIDYPANLVNAAHVFIAAFFIWIRRSIFNKLNKINSPSLLPFGHSY
jgi:hypothetical protein